MTRMPCREGRSDGGPRTMQDRRNKGTMSADRVFEKPLQPVFQTLVLVGHLFCQSSDYQPYYLNLSEQLWTFEIRRNQFS